MATENTHVPELDPVAAYQDAMRDDGVILDVREAEELAQHALSGALHIPLGELNLRVDEVPKDRNVYVLCHVGQRSAMATQFLRSLGHDRVWNIRGGIVAWRIAGLPSESARPD